MAEAAFQGGAKVGAVKAVMRRLQRGAHKGEQARGSTSRLSSVSKAKGAEVAKKKGELALTTRKSSMLQPKKSPHG